MALFRKKAIEEFVRHTLGCQCPDDVFRSIDTNQDLLVGDIAVKERIVIGGRLLMYLVEVQSIGNLEEGVLALLRAGIAERDAKGLNRFRLVIGSAEPGAVKPFTEDILDSSVSLDEKVHIHVVQMEALFF